MDRQPLLRLAAQAGIEMSMTTLRACSLAILFCAAVTPQANSVPEVWSPLQFLAGTWEGDVDGQPGSGRSVREYRFVLNNRYLEVRGRSTYPPQPKNPKGEIHEEWGMISFDGSRKTFVLRQFHVEGFVNQYASEWIREGLLRFTSEAIENIPAGYRARETYAIDGPDSFTERFEIAPPGKDFELYSQTRFRRKK
jgi:hypothetical protein